MKGELIIVGALSVVAYFAGHEYAGEWEHGVILSLAAIGLSALTVFVMNLLLAPSRIFQDQEKRICELDREGNSAEKKRDLLLVIDFDFEPDNSMHGWLRITNLGPGRALDITIDPVSRGPYTSTFDPTPFLIEDQSKVIGGWTEDRSKTNQHGFYTSRFAPVFGELLCEGVEKGKTVETMLTVHFNDESGIAHSIGYVAVFNDKSRELSVRKA